MKIIIKPSKYSRWKNRNRVMPEEVKLKVGRSGNKNGMWKGDKVGYLALHTWIQRTFGKANICEFCNNSKNSKRFEWANISGKYLRDISDWIMLCSKCHHELDDITNRGWKTRKEQYSYPNCL